MNSETGGTKASGSLPDDAAEMAEMRDADLLRKLIVAGGDWLWTTDADHCCVWLSDNVEGATGVPASELIGGSHINFVKELAETDSAAEAHLEDLLAYRAFRNFEYSIPEADPEFSRMSICGVPVFVDGVFKGYRGTGRNVSVGAARSESVARQDDAADDADRQGQLNAEQEPDVFEGISIGLSIYDADNGLIVCNARNRELFPKLAEVYKPGVKYGEVLAAAAKSGQFVISPDIAKEVELAGPEAYIESRIKRFEKPGPDNQEEFELTDGGWVRLNGRRVKSGKLIITAIDITELKAREKELEEAATRQEKILNSIPAGIVVYDKEDKFVLANKTVRDALPDMVPAMQPGVPLLDALKLAHDSGYLKVSGNEEIDALYDVDRDAWLEKFAKQYDEKHRVSERLNHDGSWVQSIDVRTDDGLYVGARIDISERKRQEEEAAAANARLQDAIDALKDGFVVWDDRDRLVICNEAFKRQVPDEMKIETGKSYRELLHDLVHSGAVADVEGREEEWIQDLLDKRGEELGKEIVFETHDGRWIMRRDQVTGNGERVGIRADITDIKKGELELALAREKADLLLSDFRTLIDTLEMGVVLVDDTLTAQVVNNAFYDIWNLGTGDVPEGCHFRDLMDINRHNNVYDIADEDWDDYVTSRCEEVAAGDVEPREFVRADGKTLIYSVTALSGGKRLVTYYDITEQKAREGALEHAQRKAELADRAKSEFLANMSHEIRTPMNGVLGMAELLAKSELNPKQKTFTDIIVKSGNALLTIINDILDFSKIDAGQLELDPAPFKLAEAIEDVATLVSTRAKEKDLELIVRVQPGLPENMIGDVGRIRQIITNLMGNAVKFTEKGHVLVEVTGEPHGDSTRLKFSVTDTGIGIPDEQISTIFEKFSQVDASSTRKHEGTGLGLTITAKLVELMGGEVGAESRLGEGSTFWFAIELKNSGTQSNAKIAPVDVTGAKVLIIDDNAVNRSILLEQTASWKFDSCAAESGLVGMMVLEGALEKGVQVECIILDYQMPGMTGFDVAQAVRSHDGLGETPIVMLTSVDQALSTREYRELGIDAHLVKPARSSQLLETLVEVIQAHRSRMDGDDTGMPVQVESNVATDVEMPAEATEQHATEPVAEPVPETQKPETAQEEQNASGSHDTLDILVAEDNEVNQIVFTQILDDTGYVYEIVGNGRLAVEAAEARGPSMILMDVSMPEMNGLEATGAIREREAGGAGHVPIVGVTAHALKGDRERCIEAGMDDYMSKPISPDALHKMIEKWLVQGDRQESVG